jgi:hypothetical protein
LTNLVRAGLTRVRNTEYAPLPTVYDGLFPNGTFLTAPGRVDAPQRRSTPHDAEDDNAR